MKRKRFWFHLNKAATRSSGSVKWTVHHSGKCYLVDSVRCFTHVETHTNRRQPIAVCRGWCGLLELKLRDGKTTAVIFN